MVETPLPAPRAWCTIAAQAAEQGQLTIPDVDRDYLIARADASPDEARGGKMWSTECHWDGLAYHPRAPNAPNLVGCPTV